MRRIIWLVVLLYIFLPVAQSARADNPPRFTLADVGQGDIQVTSIFNRAQVHFPVAEGRNIQRATLQLHLAHSDKLLPNLSALVIALNNEPAASLLLSPANAGPTFIDIDLPARALNSGDNILTFQFDLRLENTGCADANDPALWATVMADTAVELDGSDVPIHPDLLHYPAPFNSASRLSGNAQLSIILPTQPTGAELTAAAQIAASLGQSALWNQPPLHAVTIDQLTDASAQNDHLIVIDTAHRNPLAVNFAYGVSEAVSPRNPKRVMLIVSGLDDAALLNSAALLATRSAHAQLIGNHIGPQATVAQPSPVRSTRSTFVDLGFTDRQVSGIGVHNLYYAIDVPYDWKLTSDASIDLRFTHAPGLSTASALKANVNGARVADVQLNGRNGDAGRLTIQLSPRQVRPGRNWLHLELDLSIPNQDCNFRYADEAWMIVLANTSSVDLEHVTSEPPLDLHFLPTSLIVPIDLSKNVFVLPAQPSTADLSAMAIIAAELGTFSDADGLRPRATTADRFDATTAGDDHAIIVGQPQSNDLLMKYNDVLPQPLNRSSAGAIQPSGGRELYPDELNNAAGYIEMLYAPWSARGLAIVISGFTDDGVLAAATAIPVLGHQLKLQGNVAVIASQGMFGVSIGGLAGASLSIAARSKLSLILIGAVIVIGGVGLVTARHRAPTKKRKKSEEDES